ncbi:glycosyltransferase family protein [Haloflavibacter putidus]|uniref:Glycosyltransferase family 4 protein n=1 Tax=Haloflavibacter putidus TaxID=2576776 RepID=A0A507ZBX6_9FLAO|nr:glycosyltransferase family 4 protein [Haloflavibacter putidus]TQD33498.1 glycosyltransferase family 4 protein [Haloflavibacter putidus]
MANKKVLIITPFFAPESHAAVFRAHKLVKYLKRAGWQPIVLTVDTNYNYNEDASLLEELKDIPIHRAKYIEPTVRGLKMWLTGKDRTYKALKKEEENDNVAQIPTAKRNLENKPGFVQKLYSFCLAHYLKKPDRFWTWKKPAIKKAKQLIQQENIGLIYTTCLPFTTNQIGIALRKSTKVKWVADFRDPITYAKRMHSSIPHVFKLQRKIQDETFKFADHISVLSSSYKMIFHDQYEGQYNEKITFIPTGLDDDYIPKKTNIENSIVFVGEYLKEYKGDFFKVFKKTLNRLPKEKRPLLKIIGNKEINQKQALPYIDALNLRANVKFIDHLPQKELYMHIQNAKYALLIPGLTSLWWTNFAKMVDYIALQKPVIAFVPAISEAQNELSNAGLGVFLTENNESNIKKLENIFLEESENKSIQTTYCKRYLASSQTQAFIEIFNHISV